MPPLPSYYFFFCEENLFAEDVEANLAAFAGKRPDIFGTVDEEIQVKMSYLPITKPLPCYPCEQNRELGGM